MPYKRRGSAVCQQWVLLFYLQIIKIKIYWQAFLIIEMNCCKSEKNNDDEILNNLKKCI
jgi:hypothetical protein